MKKFSKLIQAGIVAGGIILVSATLFGIVAGAGAIYRFVVSQEKDDDELFRKDVHFEYNAPDAGEEEEVDYASIKELIISAKDECTDEEGNVRTEEVEANTASSVAVIECFENKPINIEEAVPVSEKKEILGQYKDIYALNNDVIGWLTIADTVIDYPVLRNLADKEYYMTRNIYGEPDKNGSIYMDIRCSVSERTDNVIIYGHNMKSGKMFGNLKAYEDEEYKNEHADITFSTLYEEGEYTVIAAFKSPVYTSADKCFKFYEFTDAKTEEEYDDYINGVMSLSFWKSDIVPHYGEDLLTLVTCADGGGVERFVVVAVKKQNN